jgi:hypothetical protein
MTTTGTYTNYGGTFGFPSGTNYPAQVLDYPELTEAALDITNHASGGVDEAIPSGLVSSGEFTIAILAQHGTYATLKTAMTNKTVNTCHLSNPIDSYVFQGFITSLKEEQADATNPDAVKITLNVKPTGGITIADTP